MEYTPESILLTDRVGVVTGAGKGIGRATALTFARFGADVAICDRDQAALDDAAAELGKTGRRVLARLLDVREPDAVANFAAATADELGPVDILVNNAGGSFYAGFFDTSLKGEDMLVRENFLQVTSCIREFVPRMRDGGSIVNVTSIEAHTASPGFAVYAAMKAAVASFTKSMALELGHRRIRVNAIAPDGLHTSGETGARAQMQETMASAEWGFDPAFLPAIGFFATPDDAASCAVFLASDLARFVNGVTLHLDGGNYAAGGWRRPAG